MAFIGNQNSFDLLAGCDSENVSVKQLPKKAAEKPAAAPVSNGAAKQSKAAPKPAQQSGGKPGDAQRDRPRRPRPTATRRPESSEAPEVIGEKPQDSRPPRRRPEREPRRERDDRTNMAHQGEKKWHVGKGNWGKPVESEQAANAEPTSETVAEPKTEAAVTESVQEPEVEKDNSKTLEEYKKQLASSRPALALPAPRKPNEGVHPNQLGKGFTELRKVLSDEEKEHSSDDSKAKKTQPKKQVIEINPYFPRPDDRRSSGPRDARRPSDQARPAPRYAPNVFDKNAFPSLGKKN